MSDDLISDLINDFWVREDDLTEDDGEEPQTILQSWLLTFQTTKTN